MENQVAIKTLACEDLITRYPPRFSNVTKQKLYKAAREKNPNLQGNLTISRWNPITLPTTIPTTVTTKFSGEENVFHYSKYEPSTEYHWHLNFANRFLFIAYGGNLYAQDEMQVMEHPVLGSVKRYLDEVSEGNRHFSPFTSVGGMPIHPTPILIEGAPRLLEVNCSGNGLYGNGFASAPFSYIEKNLTIFTPDATANSNIIAIEAPAGGYGVYDAQTITGVLLTAFSGFRAAVLRSKLLGDHVKTVIHTGHWGTGAYGGNRELMVLLQLISAHLAEVDEVVFHTFDYNGTIDYEYGLDLFKKITAKPIETEKLAKILAAKTFVWGTSDGN